MTDFQQRRDESLIMTEWTGEALSELTQNGDFFKRLFEKTGCLMTVDGSGDERITPQGLGNYHF